MSEFLVLKSTEEQKEEGVDEPVDTAFIEDRDGMPILKASFDVHHFKADEVNSRCYLSLCLSIFPSFSLSLLLLFLHVCVFNESTYLTNSTRFKLFFY